MSGSKHHVYYSQSSCETVAKLLGAAGSSSKVQQVNCLQSTVRSCFAQHKGSPSLPEAFGQCLERRQLRLQRSNSSHDHVWRYWFQAMPFLWRGHVERQGRNENSGCERLRQNRPTGIAILGEAHSAVECRHQHWSSLHVLLRLQRRLRR